MSDAFEQLRESAMKFADAALWSLSDADTLARLDLVHQAEQALTAVKLHLVREIESRDLPAAEAALTSATWLSNRLRIRPGTARRLVDLGQTLQRRPMLDQALITGEVNTEQALVIQDCLDTLPAEVGPDTIDDAERLLIRWSADFHAIKLKFLAGRILEHVAPEIAEQIEARKLAELEAAAHDVRAFSLSGPVNGMVRLRGILDVEAAAIVEAALDPLCSPRNSAATCPDGPPDGGTAKDGRRPEQRRADALVEVCRLALRTGDLPVNGGEPAQISVVVRYEPLRDNLAQHTPDVMADLISESAGSHERHSGLPRGQFGIGTLGDDRLISPATVRRIACDARILPAVLDTEGRVLDVGRSRRLFDGHLRRALVLRDRGCAFPACSRPARWSEGHHIVSWADGGPTGLSNAVLLCREHHRTIHHTDWAVRLGADGLPEFIPPAYVDRQRRPRRNLYHRRT